jgi:hypothetical protein
MGIALLFVILFNGLLDCFVRIVFKPEPEYQTATSPVYDYILLSPNSSTQNMDDKVFDVNEQ